MKLPKGLGFGGGMGDMMGRMQEAMQRAQTMETELEARTISVDKGPVKATFDGVGRLQRLDLDKEIVDPEDTEGLEDLIVAAMKDGYEKAAELRASVMEEIKGDLPNIPGLNL